jgi:hypothetical protein
MRAQLRCSPRTMFECIQSSRDTQPELVADNAARLSIDELSLALARRRSPKLQSSCARTRLATSREPR